MRLVMYRSGIDMEVVVVAAADVVDSVDDCGDDDCYDGFFVVGAFAVDFDDELVDVVVPKRTCA